MDYSKQIVALCTWVINLRERKSFVLPLIFFLCVIKSLWPCTFGRKGMRTFLDLRSVVGTALLRVCPSVLPFVHACSNYDLQGGLVQVQLFDTLKMGSVSRLKDVFTWILHICGFVWRHPAQGFPPPLNFSRKKNDVSPFTFPSLKNPHRPLFSGTE